MILVRQSIVFFCCVILQMGTHGLRGDDEFGRKNNNTESQQIDVQKSQNDTHKYQRLEFQKRRHKKSVARTSLGKGLKQRSERSPFKCSNRCQAGQEIFAKDFRCYCDRACFETFYDCCPDYVKYCGNQTKATKEKAKNVHSSPWRCVSIQCGDGCIHRGVLGVWMIQKCPPNWPFDEIKSKCQNRTFTKTFSFPAETYVPVVAENGFTYGNEYCAICNGMKNYSSWVVKVDTSVIAPEEYDQNDKLKFILDNGGRIEYTAPTEDQPRRYCTVLSQRDCKNVSHKEYQNCVNGPVQVVFSGKRYFKNMACALCQGQYDIRNGWGKSAVRGPNEQHTFSIVFRLKTPVSKRSGKIEKAACPEMTVYDKNSRFCRSGYDIPSGTVDFLADQFLISLWLVRDSSDMYNKTLLKKRFKKVAGSRLALRPNQISALQFHIQNPTSEKYLVVTFRVTLTPFDSLERLNQSNGTGDRFLTLSDSMENITIDLGKSRWKVIRMATEQLSCVGKKSFSFDEYEVDKKGGKILQKMTGEAITLKDFTILAETKDNITLCPQFVLSNCIGGTYVPLLRHEYVILSNLSLYHNATNQSFCFGKYYINKVNDDVVADVSSVEDGKVEDFFRNSTIFICLPFKTLYPANKLTSNDKNYSLWIITVGGFTISILSLILVLITYTLFPDLRTIPGKNMMNLCISLLMFQLLWLLRPLQEVETIFCTAAAILEHYFILVSFVAMAVISYHSCIAFSNRSIALKRSKNKEQKVFIKYSAIVWIPTALFIAVFLTLDQAKVFLIKYGTLCWLGTKNSKIYLFLLPIGLSLLWNIFAFIRTAIFLSQHKKQAAKLRQKGIQNLSICVKLSTLTGFPWLFAFLGASFETVVAFEYLFVIFVCSQGFYIAVAFLWNSKTVNLYTSYIFSKHESSTDTPNKGKVAITAV